MKKICLSVVGLFLTCFAAFAQPAEDSSQYKARKLKFEEANLVSSYYSQDGNHSAVTGGAGTEKLTDISNTIDLKFVGWSKKNVKRTLTAELGIDHYTSASSDNIDPHTISSASHADTRFYPSLNWLAENEAKGLSLGGGISFSHEFDYQSFGANVLFAKKTKDGSGEFSAKLQAYLDQLKVILPIELRSVTPGQREERDYPTEARNSYSTSLSYSQIINQQLQVMLIADLIYQQGYLGLPFHRVYFNDNTERNENLPGNRLKIPLGFRANYFVGDKVVLRSFYRYYMDDWGVKAHTAQFETAIKLTPFVSFTPFYRFYTQSAVDYFAPIYQHRTTEQYYTSNYDLSNFQSNFYGAGVRMTPEKGVLGIQHLSMMEVRYGHYNREDGLNSNIVSLNLQFK